VDEADTTDPVMRAGRVDEESETSALNPLWPSEDPGTVKQTVTSASVANVVVAGGAFESDRLLPQNLDLPLIEGLIVIQLALEYVAELCS
jgi:hypothetical protein